MTFVILQAPNNGYYWLLRAAKDKHFECVDKGFIEIASGEFYEMQDFLKNLEYEMAYGTGQPIILLNKITGGYSYFSEESLQYVMELSPDFLNDKIFV